jgi:hypothetical protein
MPGGNDSVLSASPLHSPPPLPSLPFTSFPSSSMWWCVVRRRRICPSRRRSNRTRAWIWCSWRRTQCRVGRRFLIDSAAAVVFDRLQLAGPSTGADSATSSADLAAPMCFYASGSGLRACWGGSCRSASSSAAALSTRPPNSLWVQHSGLPAAAHPLSPLITSHQGCLF